MRARWPLLATMLSVGVAYAAFPYVTLYRLGSAIHGADAATLESLVDWPAVREGIKEDVCDLSADDPGPTKAGTELAPRKTMSSVSGCAVCMPGDRSETSPPSCEGGESS